MPGTRYPNAEEHPPQPPFKGGNAEAKGGCYPFKGGKSEALGEKRAQGSPLHGVPSGSLIPFRSTA